MAMRNSRVACIDINESLNGYYESEADFIAQYSHYLNDTMQMVSCDTEALCIMKEDLAWSQYSEYPEEIIRYAIDKLTKKILEEKEYHIDRYYELKAIVKRNAARQDEYMTQAEIREHYGLADETDALDEVCDDVYEEPLNQKMFQKGERVQRINTKRQHKYSDRMKILRKYYYPVPKSTKIRVLEEMARASVNLGDVCMNFDNALAELYFGRKIAVYIEKHTEVETEMQFAIIGGMHVVFVDAQVHEWKELAYIAQGGMHGTIK